VRILVRESQADEAREIINSRPIPDLEGKEKRKNSFSL